MTDVKRGRVAEKIDDAAAGPVSVPVRALIC